MSSNYPDPNTEWWLTPGATPPVQQPLNPGLSGYGTRLGSYRQQLMAQQWAEDQKQKQLLQQQQAQQQPNAAAAPIETPAPDAPWWMSAPGTTLGKIERGFVKPDGFAPLQGNLNLAGMALTAGAQGVEGLVGGLTSGLPRLGGAIGESLKRSAQNLSLEDVVGMLSPTQAVAKGVEKIGRQVTGQQTQQEQIDQAAIKTANDREGLIALNPSTRALANDDVQAFQTYLGQDYTQKHRAQTGLLEQSFGEGDAGTWADYQTRNIAYSQVADARARANKRIVAGEDPTTVMRGMEKPGANDFADVHALWQDRVKDYMDAQGRLAYVESRKSGKSEGEAQQWQAQAREEAGRVINATGRIPGEENPVLEMVGQMLLDPLNLPGAHEALQIIAKPIVTPLKGIVSRTISPITIYDETLKAQVQAIKSGIGPRMQAMGDVLAKKGQDNPLFKTLAFGFEKVKNLAEYTPSTQGKVLSGITFQQMGTVLSGAQTGPEAAQLLRTYVENPEALVQVMGHVPVSVDAEVARPVLKDMMGKLENLPSLSADQFNIADFLKQVDPILSEASNKIAGFNPDAALPAWQRWTQAAKSWMSEFYLKTPGYIVRNWLGDNGFATMDGLRMFENMDTVTRELDQFGTLTERLAKGTGGALEEAGIASRLSKVPVLGTIQNKIGSIADKAEKARYTRAYWSALTDFYGQAWKPQLSETTAKLFADAGRQDIVDALTGGLKGARSAKDVRRVAETVLNAQTPIERFHVTQFIDRADDLPHEMAVQIETDLRKMAQNGAGQDEVAKYLDDWRGKVEGFRRQQVATLGDAYTPRINLEQEAALDAATEREIPYSSELARQVNKGEMTRAQADELLKAKRAALTRENTDLAKARQAMRNAYGNLGDNVDDYALAATLHGVDGEQEIRNVTRLKADARRQAEWGKESADRNWTQYFADQDETWSLSHTDMGQRYRDSHAALTELANAADPEARAAILEKYNIRSVNTRAENQLNLARQLVGDLGEDFDKALRGQRSTWDAARAESARQLGQMIRANPQLGQDGIDVFISAERDTVRRFDQALGRVESWRNEMLGDQIDLDQYRKLAGDEWKSAFGYATDAHGERLQTRLANLEIARGQIAERLTAMGKSPGEVKQLLDGLRNGSTRGELEQLLQKAPSPTPAGAVAPMGNAVPDATAPTDLVEQAATGRVGEMEQAGVNEMEAAHRMFVRQTVQAEGLQRAADVIRQVSGGDTAMNKAMLNELSLTAEGMARNVLEHATDVTRAYGQVERILGDALLAGNDAMKQAQDVAAFLQKAGVRRVPGLERESSVDAIKAIAKELEIGAEGLTQGARGVQEVVDAARSAPMGNRVDAILNAPTVKSSGQITDKAWKELGLEGPRRTPGAILKEWAANTGEAVAPMGNVTAVDKGTQILTDATPYREAVGADPNKVYRVRYKVVSLDDLNASHTDGLALNPKYPQALQPRMRDRAASQLQIEGIAQKLNPDALLNDSWRIDAGAPIIGPDGIVESGNGRTLALRRARAEHPEQWGNYQTQLREALPQYGLSEAELAGIKDPVLVRERLTSVDRAAFAAEANSSGVIGMSPLELARADAGRVSDVALTNLPIGDGQSLDQALLSPANKDLVRGFLQAVPANERAALVTAEGKLNQAGLTRLKAGMFAKTYPGEAGARLTSTFFESVDPVMRNIESGMMSSLPDMARMEGQIAAGARDAAYSLGEDVSKAVDQLARLKAEGKKAKDFVAQTSMIARELTPNQEQLLLWFEENGRSQKRVREFLQQYAREVDKLPPPNQGMLIASEAPTREKILEQLTHKQFEDEATLAGNAGGLAGSEGEGIASGDRPGRTAGQTTSGSGDPTAGTDRGGADRLSPEQHAALDEWRRTHPDADPITFEQKLTAEEQRQIDALGKIRAGILPSWGVAPMGNGAATLPKGARNAVEGEIDRLAKEFYQTRAAGVAHAEGRADFAQLDYGRKRGFDTYAAAFAPYYYWGTRQGRNFAIRMLEQPQYLANYLRYDAAQKKINANRGLRGRFEGGIEMAPGVFINPLAALFPFAGLVQTDWDNADAGKSTLAQIYDMASAAGFRPGPWIDLPFRYLNLGVDAPMGTPERAAQEADIGRGSIGNLLPQTGLLQGVTAMAGMGPGGTGINIEQPFRRFAGIPEQQAWDPYIVARSVRDMAVEAQKSVPMGNGAAFDNKPYLLAQALIAMASDPNGGGWNAMLEGMTPEVAARELGVSPEEAAQGLQIARAGAQQAMSQRGIRQLASSIGGQSIQLLPEGERAYGQMSRDLAATRPNPTTGVGNWDETDIVRRANPALAVGSASGATAPGSTMDPQKALTDRARNQFWDAFNEQIPPGKMGGQARQIPMVRIVLDQDTRGTATRQQYEQAAQLLQAWASENVKLTPELRAEWQQAKDQRAQLETQLVGTFGQEGLDALRAYETAPTGEEKAAVRRANKDVGRIIRARMMFARKNKTYARYYGGDR